MSVNAPEATTDVRTSTPLFELLGSISSGSAALVRVGDLHAYPEVACSQCGATFGPGPSGFSSCAEHTPPEYLLAAWWPVDPKQVRRVTLHGVQLTVLRDSQEEQEELHYQFGTIPAEPASEWVTAVQLGNVWFDRLAFAEPMLDALDKALPGVAA